MPSGDSWYISIAQIILFLLFCLFIVCLLVTFYNATKQIFIDLGGDTESFLDSDTNSRRIEKTRQADMRARVALFLGFLWFLPWFVLLTR